MIEPTLLVSSLLAFISAAIYSYVGNRLSQRQIRFVDTRLAWTFFIVWWYSLAAMTLVRGLVSLLGAGGALTLPLLITFTYLNLLAICVALFGLMYYLLYLFLAQSDWWQLGSVLIGLGASLAILIAYLPPDWIKRRYRVYSIAEEAL